MPTSGKLVCECKDAYLYFKLAEEYFDDADFGKKPRKYVKRLIKDEEVTKNLVKAREAWNKTIASYNKGVVFIQEAE